MNPLAGLIDPVDFRMRCFREWGYTPHKGQMQVHTSAARFRTWAAAARVGKSFAASREALVRMHYPIKQTIWVVGPTYTIADKIFGEVWNFVHEPKRRCPPIAYKSRKYLSITFENGTQFNGKSADNPESLLGEGVDLIIVDEASRISADVYDNYLIHRLTTTQGDLLNISTPRGRGSKFEEYYNWGKSIDPRWDDYESFESSLSDNPAIPAAEIERLRETLGFTSPLSFEQEVMGRFVSFEGDVFPSFTEEKFFGEIEPLQGYPVQATIDIGTRNPCAILFFQDIKSQIRFFDEYYMVGRSSMDNAYAIMDKFKHYNVKRATFDPEELDARLTFGRIIKGCAFVPGNNDKILGYDVIRDHLNHDPYSKKPFMVFDKKRMPNTLNEFRGIHYNENDKEIPDEKDLHAIAAIRYHLLKFRNFLRRTSANLILAPQNRVSLLNNLTGAELGERASRFGDVDRKLWMGDGRQ